MFAVDQFIDTVQNGKKYFVSTFVTDEPVRKSLNAFVDAQTEFVKQIVKNILTFTNTAPNPAIVNMFASVSFILCDCVILLW
mgnify:CR=1 FL=1